MAAPINNLLGAISGVQEIGQNFKKSDLLDKENESRRIANEKANMELGSAQDLDKMLKNPSPLGDVIKSGYKGTIGLYVQSNPIKDPNAADSINKINQLIDDPNSTAEQVSQAMKTSPLLAALKDVTDKKIQADALAARTKPIADARMASVEVARDSQAARAADHFDKDSILTKINKQKQQVELDRHTLESSNGRLTPGLINEIQQGVANAISGGGSAGLGKTEQIEVQNAKQRLAKLQEKFSTGVQYVDDPELTKYFQDILKRLGDAYDKNAYQRAKQIFNGRTKAYKSNPAAIEVMKEKLDSYLPPEPISAPGGASAAPPHGQTVQQNGHVYNWNPATGQYE